jgi:hypothetical protein
MRGQTRKCYLLNVDEKILTAHAADREFCAKFR